MMFMENGFTHMDHQQATRINELEMSHKPIAFSDQNQKAPTLSEGKVQGGKEAGGRRGRRV